MKRVLALLLIILLVPAYAFCDTATYTVGASGDDGYGKAPATWNSGGGNMLVGQQYFCFTRYTGVAIPQGAKIVYAHVAFLGAVSPLSLAGNVTIALNDVDNSSAPTNWNELNTMAVTTGTSWDMPLSNIDYFTHTVDMSSELQEVVDRGSWSSGNAMTVRFAYNSGAYRFLTTYDASTTPPQMYVVWTSTRDGGDHWQVSAGSDDGHGSAGGFSDAVTFLYWNDSSGYDRTFARLLNIEIPAGATIHEAGIIVTSGSIHGDASGDNTYIYLNDADDASAPTNGTELMALVKTTASITYSKTAAWKFYEPICITGFQSVVDEILDRDGWASGNDMQVILEWDEGSSPVIKSYDYELHQQGPVLWAIWDEGEPPPSGWPNDFGGVPNANIGSIGGTAIADIGSIGGTE